MYWRARSWRSNSCCFCASSEGSDDFSLETAEEIPVEELTDGVEDSEAGDALSDKSLLSLAVFLAWLVWYWNTISSISAGGESRSSRSVSLLLAGLSETPPSLLLVSTLAELVRRFGGGDMDRWLSARGRLNTAFERTITPRSMWGRGSSKPENKT